jgi:alkylation response protein AidB-like acyl-CoA dehydrogenase
MAQPADARGDVDWLARAREVVTLVERDAEAAERQGTLTDPVVGALAGAGLFGLAVPRALGGAEQGLETQLVVFEEISRADGSAGWCLMASATASAFAAAFCAKDAAREMFGTGAWVAHAGQLAPRGRGESVEGGYRVEGEYSFGSGAHYAQWMAAGFIPLYDGQPRMQETGLPEMRVACLPKQKVILKGNWHVAGLQGTGSVDYGVPTQLVPHGLTFDLFTREPQTGGDRFRVGILTLTAVGHAGFALGVGRRALDEIRRLSRAKIRMGAPVAVAEHPTFQHEYARQEARMRSAKALVFDAFGAVERAVLEGREPSLEERALVRTATTWATEAAADVADFAYRSAGTDSLRLPSTLQRAWRDIHAGTQHVFVDEHTYTNSAQVWLGLAPPHVPL